VGMIQWICFKEMEIEDTYLYLFLMGGSIRKDALIIEIRIAVIRVKITKEFGKIDLHIFNAHTHTENLGLCVYEENTETASNEGGFKGFHLWADTGRGIKANKKW